MAYPESCFTDLIAIRGICEPKDAKFFLDDVPGIDLTRLAQLANTDAPSGEKLGVKLIESAARLMIADVEALYDATYKVQSSLVNGCSSCAFVNNYLSGAQRGVLVKDNTTSSFSRLLIDKLVAKVNQTGTFNIVLDDGTVANRRVIPNAFEAGVQYDIQGIKYLTRNKQVRIYLEEAGVPLAQLSCKRGGSGCGCSGVASVVDDLMYTGTFNGAEVQQAYGFQPCAGIVCNADDVLCYLAHSAPNMIGITLLFKAAEQYFLTQQQSTRNNKIAGNQNDAVKEDVKKYESLYKAKLDGTKTRGLKDIVFTTLKDTHDVCVVCNSMLGTSWATG